MKNVILEKIDWSFNGDVYSSKESFKSELLSLQSDNFDESVLDEICVIAPEIEVSYWTYVGDHQVERKVIINANNGRTLSGLEILYKLNKLIGSDMEAIDHYFFQGLVENETSKPFNSRSFEIWQGS